MFYSKKRGKPQLDASGNLILSKNDDLFSSTSSSAGPRNMSNVRYVMLKPLGFMGKVKASLVALSYVWGAHE
tara:strand:- start:3740 stop:3955 length:216 start_codon:yes stop_codon:yes gene_type:complete